MKIGCCGFVKSKEQYFKTFELVEVQQTFYKIPSLETLEKWRKVAPSGFEFTLKAWQVITHPPSSPTYKRLGYRPDNCGFFRNNKVVFYAWEKTLDACKALKANKIIFQCPASFKSTNENIENMKNFFTSIKRNDIVFIWEPRGKWDEEIIKNLCEELDLIHCVDPFKNKQVYGEFQYYRLHGIGGYNYKYTLKDLEWLATICKDSGYVLFNNVYMYEDALEFKKMIKKWG
jgi:uncharacterized protein YecE (DUF72 family)